jgi:hypothetical protein
MIADSGFATVTNNDPSLNTSTAGGRIPLWTTVANSGRVVARGYGVAADSPTDTAYLNNLPETSDPGVVEIYIPVYKRNTGEEIVEFVRDAKAARQAMLLAWNKETREAQFKALLEHHPVPDQKLQRFTYGRERLRMPVRERFKKRVCGGHQRYRVMVN